LDEALATRLLEGQLGDPFSLLGPRELSDESKAESPKAARKCLQLCCYFPGAISVQVYSRPAGTIGSRPVLLGSLTQCEPDTGGELAHRGIRCGIFCGDVTLTSPAPKYAIAYMFHVTWPGPDGRGAVQITEDAYAFGLLLSDFDLHLIREGRHRQPARCLGSQVMTIDGVEGVRFAIWAPNARRVSVIGDFNQWDGRRNPMRLRQSAGVWELFVPRLGDGALYKYEIIGPRGELLPAKADPMARATEVPPATASRVVDDRKWVAGRYRQDQTWMQQRPQHQSRQKPMSIYEVHPASWIRKADQGGRPLEWMELADRLIPYVKGMGFTHVDCCR